MLKEKNKIIALFGMIPITAVMLVSFSLIFVAVYGINNYFDKQMIKQEKEIQYKTINQSKKDIKSVYGLINNINLIVKNSFKREIKIAVEVGNSLITSIYNSHKNLPREEIIDKIKSKLKDFRFYKDKSGYFFIYDMNGNLKMLPIKHNLEGKNLLNYKDIKGKFIIRRFIKRLKETPNGVFESWYYYKPNTKIIQEKLGYSKLFKPLNIFIGSAVYEDIVKKEINKRIKQFISKLSSSINGKNFMVMCDNGNIIYSSDRKLLNKNQFNKYKKIIFIAKNNQEKLNEAKIDDNLIIFTYYKALKLTIIQRIDLKELHKTMETQKNNINKVVSLVIKQFLITTLFFVVLILGITLYFTHLIKKIFYRYDETLNKEKEKAEQGAKAKAEFLANMSHEIRTPLNAMFGFIQILQDKELDNESEKYLNIIEKSGENLLIIINDILDFSKIESGKFKIENIEFNPKEDIEVIHELFSSKADEKHITLKIKEENLKYNIFSDPTRIKQIIANLLSNAIKFTPENNRITLSLKYNQNKEELFVEIKDEGIGISSDKINNIFEAFSQADSSTTRKYGGTGLGLTISYKLVQLLGGELKVKSEVGKGSRFYFTIPAKKGELSKKVIQKKDKMLMEKFDYHILVVEDNLANQMFMKVILKKMGITFDIANNGIEAIEFFKQNKYDFILMDENMPEMNGIEATKKIIEIEDNKKLEHTVIIALTANALEGDKDRFILAGMDYYLSKPLDIKKLKNLINKIKG